MSDTANIIAGVNLLAELLLKAKQAYDVHRAAAIAAGVPESAMKTADAIFARDDEDPLAAPVWPPTEPEPVDFPYFTILNERPNAADLKPGDKVHQSDVTGKWMVTRPGIGANPTLDFKLIETIGA